MLKNRRTSPVLLIFTLLGVVFINSCGLGERDTAVLWTDRPEFALYADHFNTLQNRYTVEFHYLESPAQNLTGGPEGADERPDIVAGSWLKSASTRTLFRPLDEVFRKELVSKPAFYPRLLAQGNIEGKQYLLPVSFNLPALVFSRDYSQSLSNPFTIELEEIRKLGKAYNTEGSGAYTRMGFSPSWNDEFLFVSAALFDASFREAAPLAWDAQALEQAMTWIHQWIIETNGGLQAEDDFAFKYLYDPPAKLVMSGRILFTYMDSSRFFTLGADRRSALDFRWIANKNAIPLDEESVFYGIYKRGRAKKAAMAFTQWFFQAETQRQLLESHKNKRISDLSFGVAGGFSAMRTVTEQIYPQFYPGLLGHMPPESFLSPPNILPRNWTLIKEKVILPYLRDRIRRDSREEVRPLERRLSDWYRLNRD